MHKYYEKKVKLYIVIKTTMLPVINSGSEIPKSSIKKDTYIFVCKHKLIVPCTYHYLQYNTWNDIAQ